MAHTHHKPGAPRINIAIVVVKCKEGLPNFLDLSLHHHGNCHRITEVSKNASANFKLCTVYDAEVCGQRSLFGADGRAFMGLLFTFAAGSTRNEISIQQDMHAQKPSTQLYKMATPALPIVSNYTLNERWAPSAVNSTRGTQLRGQPAKHQGHLLDLNQLTVCEGRPTMSQSLFSWLLVRSQRDITEWPK